MSLLTLWNLWTDIRCRSTAVFGRRDLGFYHKFQLFPLTEIRWRLHICMFCSIFRLFGLGRPGQMNCLLCYVVYSVIWPIVMIAHWSSLIANHLLPLLFNWSCFFQKKEEKLLCINATFNNISFRSWRSVLLVEETGLPGENHRPVASHWQSFIT